MSKTKPPFPIKQFHSYMTQTSSIKAKMAPIIAQFQKNNISWMFAAVSELQRILKTPKQNIVYRFNSVFVIKIFLDLCEIPLTNMIETYIWDYIYEAATYNCTSKQQNKYANYFTQKQGYPSSTKNIETFSFNFMTMAVQLIFAGAAIKPKKLFENIQLQHTDSKFSQCFKKLKSLKLQQPAQFAFYKSGFQTLRQKYISKLKNYEISVATPYTDLFLNLTNRMLEHGLQIQLAAPVEKQAGQPGLAYADIKKIMASGDLFLTNQTISFCLKQLNQNEKMNRKINALQFLHQFIQWGDMDAYLMLIKNTTLDTITKKIATDSKLSSAPKTLQRKKHVFPQITDKRQREKVQIFYEEFLKKVDMWADLPTAQKYYTETTQQKNIKFKQIYKFLKEKCMLQFPDNAMKQHFRNQAQNNFKKNSERSLIILEEGEQQQQQENSVKQTQSKQSPSKNQTSSINSSKIPQTKKEKIHQHREQSTPGQTPGNQLKAVLAMKMTYNVFKTAIKTARQHVEQIKAPTTNFSDRQAMKIDDYLSSLVSFQQNFQTFIENLDEASESKVDQIMEEGIEVCDKIQAIKKVYDQYKSGKMNFEEFKRIVSNNQKHNKQSSQSHVKIEQKKQQPKNVSQSSLNSLNEKPLGFKNDANTHKNITSQTSFHPPKNISPHVQQKIQHKHEIHQSSNTLNAKPLSIKHEKDEISEISKHSKFQKFSQLSDSSSFHDQTHFKQSRKQLIDDSKNHHNEVPVDFKKSSQKVFEQPSDDHYSHNEKPSKKQFEQVPIKNVSNVHHDSSPEANYNHESIVKQYDENNYQVNIIPEVMHEKQRNDPHALKNHNQPVSKIYENQDQQYIRKPNSQILSKQQYSKITNDFIEQPDLSPLDQSFHNAEQIRQKIQHNQDPSFKSCFTMDKYLLSIRNAAKNQKSKKQQIFWLGNEAQNLMNFKMKPVNEDKKDSSRVSFKNSESKFGDSKVSRVNSQNKSVFTVPQLLEERNRKFKQEMQYMEKAKQQEVEQLKKKIRDLENKGKYYEAELTKKQHEIQSLRSNSEFGGDDGTKSKNDYINDQNMLFKNKMSNPLKTPNKRFNRDMGFSFTSQKPKSQYIAYKPIMPQGKLISSKPYQQYYNQYKKEKQKRFFLKHKQLVFKDQLIEVGCLVHKVQEEMEEDRFSYQDSDNYLKCGKLKIIFYITPSIEIDNFHYDISESHDLRIESQPKKFTKIQPKRQQKLLLEVSIYDLPYCIPKIQFIYEANFKEFRKKISVPCLFHKFLHIKEMKEEFIRNEISESLRVHSLRRGEQVPYSRKILKDLKDLTIIQDYLPGIKLLDGGLTNQKGEIGYAGLCHFGEYKFLLKICIKPNQFFYIQAVNMTNEKARNRIIQDNGKKANKRDELVIDFSISLLSHLFMKDIDWV